MAVEHPPVTIYWHRDLPPVEAELMGEHTIEASSYRVPDKIANREELWSQCKEDLTGKTRVRVEEEIARLGGRYAHIVDEWIDTRHDPATGEAWLHGRFNYMLYR